MSSDAVEALAEFMVATPGYFKTLRVPIRAGRDLGDEDVAGGRPVMVINETMARKYFAGQDPLGKKVSFDWGGGPREIVGVVADMRRRGLETAPVAEMYVPFAQRPVSSLMLAARFTAGEDRAGDALRRAVTRVDPRQAVYDVSSMSGIIDDSLARRRVDMTLLGIFAAVALALAALGIYGVVAVSVAQRTRELGIRMALGARAHQVRGLVLGQGLDLVALGLVLGGVASLGVVRLLTSMLFGTSAADPLTYGVTAAALGLAAVVASWVPARRATRIDPMVALRAD